MAHVACGAGPRAETVAVKTPDVLVIGGGVVGLAVAWQLARLGARVSLVEMEGTCGTHASGRNAAIFRSVDGMPETPLLAAHSRKLLASLGLPDAIRMVGLAQQAGPEIAHAGEPLGPGGVQKRLPFLAHLQLGFRWFPQDGVLDIHRVITALVTELRHLGVPIHLGRAVRLVRQGARVTVIGQAREELPAGMVVLAAGAWSGAVAAGAGLGLPITPLGRQLTHFTAVPGLHAAHPVVWLNGNRELYFRPESGGVLASGCEESAAAPGEQACNAEATHALAVRLLALSPAFAGAAVRHSWTCQRTFAPDRALVVGPDPHANNLVWATALGGRGMTCGLAVGEMVARSMTSNARLPDAWAPARLLGAAG